IADRAAWLAAASSHPLSQALLRALPASTRPPAPAREIAGAGVEAVADGVVWRLGNAGFCGAEDSGADDHSRVWLSRDGAVLASFGFSDRPRPEAAATLAALAGQKLPS